MLNLDKIELYINAIDMSDLLVRYHVHYSMYDSVGSFEAEISPVRDRWVPKPLGKDTFLFKVCDKKMMKGYIDGFDFSTSKEHTTLHIRGRDILAVLMDNSFLFPSSYPKADTPNKSWTLEKVVDDVFTAMRGTVPAAMGQPKQSLTGFYPNVEPGYTYTTNAKAILKRLPSVSWLKVSAGETYFEFLSKLLNSSGLYMFVEPGTEKIVIHNFFLPTGEVPQYDYNGEISRSKLSPYEIHRTLDGVSNIKTLDIRSDRSNYYTYIKVVGSANSEGAVTTSGYVSLKQELIGYANQSVNRFKVNVINEADEYIWKKIPEVLVYNMAFNQARTAFPWRATLANHSLPNTNEPYFINRTVEFFDEFLFGPDQGESCFVTEVDFEGSKNAGQSTQLSFMPKGITQSLQFKKH